ncbi:hypothetical protein EXIGLDRAFT_761051 [Exidia glandulosa HHB12029]|uniref:Carbohydrate esterase 2 N-terminal domain-containing protein n=1 Tax=Exidia glandulosa HHB12029 TaxID=1314781 RepID=A0A165NPH5_EXIGL|nr:hypothetical protein EXIGLDRAFT_761051 [Exidia glandulosa HHB12029]
MAETTYEVRFDDTDPVVSYTPYVDGLSSAGWTTVFSGGTKPSINGRTFGVGDSTHVTRTAGSSFSFEFHGSSIRLLGNANGATYTITIDGDKPSSPKPSGTTLASFNGLQNGAHTLTLQVTKVSSDAFAFDQAIFTVGTGLSGATVSNATYTSRDSAWTYDPGAWHSLGPLSPIPHDGLVVLGTTNAASPATIHVQGDAIILYGDAFADHGLYEVHVDGQAWDFNGTASGFIQDAVIFFHGGLDRTQQHVLWIIGKVPGSYVDFDYVSVIQVQGGSPLQSGPATGQGQTSSPGGGQSSQTSSPSSLPPNSQSSVASLTGTSADLTNTAAPPGSSPTSSQSSNVPVTGSQSQSEINTSSTSSSSISGGLIAGVVVAAFVAALLLSLLIFLIARHRRRKARPLSTTSLPMSEHPSAAPQPWTSMPGTPNSATPMMSRKGLPPPRATVTSVASSDRPTSSVNPSDSASAAPLAPGDMERVLQFVASRLDMSSGRASGSDNAAAPPQYA